MVKYCLKNALVVANGLREKCQGTITRERTTKGENIERSTLDFVLVSQDLENYIKKVVVDENRVNILTKVTQNKHGTKTVSKDDHNIIEPNLNVNWNKSLTKDRVEMYNIKNKQCQEKFKEYTNNTDIFDSSKDLNILTKKFLKRLNGCISKCFTKNRNTKNGNSKLFKLYEKLHKFKKDKLDKEIKDTEEEIASETVEIILEETKGLDSENGGFNTGHMWKLKKKIIPKAVNVPTAMRTSE